MKKSLLLLFALALGMVSCLKETSTLPVENGTVDMSRFGLSKMMTVSPEAGMVAVVKDAQGNVVCRTGVAMTFPVDKNATYTTTYEVSARSMAAPSEWFASYEQTLCFEDSDSGDNDYNDLVLYVRQRVVVDQTKPAGHQNVYYLDITPIAAGAANRNGFGFETSEGVTRLITDDYARDFFSNDVFDPARMGSSAFAPVNCAKWMLAKEQPKPYNTITVGGFDLGDNPRINFFVKTATGEKHYITTDPAWPASQQHAALFDGRPFGLSIPGKFAYPAETISIFEVYPDFAAWVAGEKATFLNGNEVVTKLYLPLEGLSDLYRFTNDTEPVVKKLVKSITNQSNLLVTPYEYDAQNRVISVGAGSWKMRVDYYSNYLHLWNDIGDESQKWYGTRHYIDDSGRLSGGEWDASANSLYTRRYIYDDNNRIVEIYTYDRQGEVHPRYTEYRAIYTWNDAGDIVAMEVPEYIKWGYDHPRTEADIIPGTEKYAYTYYNLPNKCNIELVRPGSEYFDLEFAYLPKSVTHCVSQMLGARTAHLVKSSAHDNGLTKTDYEYTLDQDGYVTYMKTVVSSRSSTAGQFSVTKTTEQFIEYF